MVINNFISQRHFSVNQQISHFWHISSSLRLFKMHWLHIHIKHKISFMYSGFMSINILHRRLINKIAHALTLHKFHQSEVDIILFYNLPKFSGNCSFVFTISGNTLNSNLINESNESSLKE